MGATREGICMQYHRGFSGLNIQWVFEIKKKKRSFREPFKYYRVDKQLKRSYLKITSKIKNILQYLFSQLLAKIPIMCFMKISL